MQQVNMGDHVVLEVTEVDQDCKEHPESFQATRPGQITWLQKFSLKKCNYF